MSRTRRWPGRFPFVVSGHLPKRVLNLFLLTLCLFLALASDSSGQNFSENFDGVTAPSLPAGWTATNTEVSWVSTSNTSSSPPNSAFVNEPTYVTDKRLDTPPIAIPAGGAQLLFTHFYSLELMADGGVLEISIAGSAFQDILDAGGTFLVGQYDSDIPDSSPNPLHGRSVWTGNSPGYITTVVNLPSGAASQTIQLRWRMGTDVVFIPLNKRTAAQPSGTAGFAGWSVDSVSIPTAGFGQNFDQLTPPALPPGWTAGNVGDWVTDTISSDTPPNNAHADELPYVNDRQLTSPSIAIPATGTASLTFRNRYDMETDIGFPDVALDFGTLEISIAGGAFQDILAAGGVFGPGGGYDHSGNTVWGGTSNAYVTTVVTLPASANGQNVQFRWHFVSDGTENGQFHDGWRIDTITVGTPVACPPTAVATADSPSICADSFTILRGSGGNSCVWSPATWLSDPTSCTPTVTPGGEVGVVDYTLTVTDSQCPPGSNTDTATVTVTSEALPVAVAEASPDTVCPGASATLTGSGGTSCSWAGPNVADPNSCTTTATPPFTAFYTLTVSNSCGTSRATTRITVTLEPEGPGVDAPSTALSGQTDLIASIQDPVDTVLYTWTITNGTITSSVFGPSIVFTAGDIGTLTLTVTATNGTCISNPTSVEINVLPPCSDPAPPPSAEIRPSGNPDGPVTGIDFLDLCWTEPTPVPAFYIWSLNGAPAQTTTDTCVLGLPPTGNNNAITLSVRAACSDEEFSEATEVTVSPAPPGAEFSVPSSVVVGATVTFTDTSDPDATSWLWIFGDGGVARTQSANHAYESPGIYTVWLIASNGAGASSVSHQLTVTPVGAAQIARGRTRSLAFEPTKDPVRRKLMGVRIARTGRTWLHVTSSEETREAIVFLRFLDPQGALVAERRLSVGPGQNAIYDIGAYGLRGEFNLEIVSPSKIQSSLVEPLRTRTVEERRP